MICQKNERFISIFETFMTKIHELPEQPTYIQFITNVRIIRGLGRKIFLNLSERQGGIWSPKVPLPIRMVLQSGRSLKSEMLSLTRTPKYVNSTSVLSIKKSEEESGLKRLTKLDSYCSDRLMFMIFLQNCCVKQKHLCNWEDQID